MLRPIPLVHYINLMLGNGHRVEELLAGTAIRPELLDSPDYLITQDDYQRFIDNMLQAAGDRGLGLEFGVTYEAAHFGILAYAGLSCQTIREGMAEIWSRYGSAFGANTRLDVVSEDAGSAIIGIQAPWRSEPIYRFSVEEALCVLLKIGGALTGTDSVFDRLEFSYPEPDYAQRYRTIFRCPLSFDATRTCAVVPSSWLDSPLKTSDSELNRICRGRLEQVLRQAESAHPVSVRVRDHLLNRMTNLPSLEEIAREFDLSPRTLTRRLKQEGYTYSRLAKNLRRELAIDWLLSSQMCTKEICFRLGFQDITAFRRAFKEWTGQTVKEYRATSGAAHSASAGAPAPE
jgi:AraC-like DNA-binding protein